jgi:hypothetical protein
MNRARALCAVLMLAAPALADTSLPSPPSESAPGPWAERCRASLERAKQAMIAVEPAFASARIKVEGKGVLLDAYVADHEHMRFYPKPAHYFVHVLERKSDAPGALGASVGSPGDNQASVGLTRWTRTRWADLDVQVVDGGKAFHFQRLFVPAADDCLR